MRHKQKKGEARNGTTGEPFDEPRAQNSPALRVACGRAPAALRRSDDGTASPYAPRRAGPIASPARNADVSIRVKQALGSQVRFARIS